jgi:excinuclease UvrABC nuclease subunit
MSADLKAKVRALPHKPGVYLMRDRLGRVIYVGKARSLRKRVGQYFHPSRQMRWDPKTRALIESIADFDTYIVHSEPEALLLESKFIKDFKPRYNAFLKDAPAILAPSSTPVPSGSRCNGFARNMACSSKAPAHPRRKTSSIPATSCRSH